MGLLSERAKNYVSGPSWEPLRPAYFSICDAFLGLDVQAKGELTTIYVKFSVVTESAEQVYAVIWLRTSKRLVLGMALPEETESPLLTTAPQGCKYKGLTRYLTINPGDALPPELDLWAKQAYEQVITRRRTET
jgi:hypothetical protein